MRLDEGLTGSDLLRALFRGTNSWRRRGERGAREPRRILRLCPLQFRSYASGAGAKRPSGNAPAGLVGPYAVLITMKALGVLTAGARD